MGFPATFPATFPNGIGGSVDVFPGTATGTEPFGGTSGAAPMVTGSAALLVEGERAVPQASQRFGDLAVRPAALVADFPDGWNRTSADDA